MDYEKRIADLEKQIDALTKILETSIAVQQRQQNNIEQVMASVAKTQDQVGRLIAVVQKVVGTENTKHLH